MILSTPEMTKAGTKMINKRMLEIELIIKLFFVISGSIFLTIPNEIR